MSNADTGPVQYSCHGLGLVLKLLGISVSLLVKNMLICTVFHRYKDFFTEVLAFFKKIKFL